MEMPPCWVSARLRPVASNLPRGLSLCLRRASPRGLLFLASVGVSYEIRPEEWRS